MIQSIKISDREVEKLLLQEENHFCDLKSIDIRPSKLTRTIAAFANAEGGELFIGVEDKPRRWSGFENMESANSFLQVFEEFFPLGTDFEYQFLENKNCIGYVLKAQIAKTRALKSASNQKVYVRRGAQNIPVEDEERLQLLKRNKGIVSFETELINCPKDMVTNSIHIISFLLEVVPTAEPEPWLKKQMAIVDDKSSVAALLLFSEEPQAVLPKRCGLKVYRYKTDTEEGSRETLDFDPISIEGNIYNQIKEAVDKTTEIIESVRLKTKDKLVQVNYPQEAIHEVITNAVIHRDYSITDDIHIQIYDNRVEVKSPGTLPGHITAENILSERFARNPVIVRLINKFPDPPNKDVGEGLNTAFESMRNLKLKPPEIRQEGAYVNVVLKHESLATPEEAILTYLLKHDSIANRQARDICFIQSENTMKRIIQGLMKLEYLERVPGTTRYTAAYQLTDKGKLEAEKYA